MSQDQRARVWRRIIASTRRKLNFGWWLEMLGPLCVGFSVLAASTLLYLRTQTWFADHVDLAGLVAGITLALLPVIAWLVARGRFIGNQEAAVRLESEMRLHNALSVAQAEVGQWPEPPIAPKIRDGLAWNWQRLVIPPVIAVLLVGTAFLIPVRPLQAKAAPQNEPSGWKEMEDWLEELKEEKVAEEEKVKELLRQIEALRDQPEEQWFNHSSLEATDNLRDGLRKSLKEMEKDFSAAERSLDALDKYSSQMTEAARQQLMEEYNDALKGLEFGKLPITEEMLKALQEMDPKQLGQGKEGNGQGEGKQGMTAEQQQKLREALKKNAEALQKMLGEGAGKEWGDAVDGEEELMRMLGRDGQGMPGQQPGQGGVTRGRGDAPMFHNDEESNLGTKNLEGVTNEDLSRAAPGDVLGLGEAKHDIDQKVIAPQDAGAVKSTGQGGETIWEEDLLPSEREVLKRYFK